MNKKIKNILFALAIFLSTVLGGGLVRQGWIGTASANPSILQSYYLNDKTATTTPVTFLAVNGASSTLAFDTYAVDSIDLNVQWTASTSASILNYVVSFSNETGCANLPTGCNWFYEDIYTTGLLSISHSSSTPYHQWKTDLSNNATSTRNFSITPVGARFTRVQLQATGGAGAVWALAVTKSQKP